MQPIYIVFHVLVAIVCLLAIVSGFRFFLHAHPPIYDYLDLLSYTEWKTPEQIKDEFLTVRNYKIMLYSAKFNLSRLANQGWADRQILEEEGKLAVYQYKKRLRRKIKIKKEKKVKPAILEPGWAPA